MCKSSVLFLLATFSLSLLFVFVRLVRWHILIFQHTDGESLETFFDCWIYLFFVYSIAGNIRVFDVGDILLVDLMF